MQRYTVYFIWRRLYMFRVVPPPIIRSANNCICSIWYLSHRYCYLPLSWKSWNWFECAVGGVRWVCCGWRTLSVLWVAYVECAVGGVRWVCCEWRTPYVHIASLDKQSTHSNDSKNWLFLSVTDHRCHCGLWFLCLSITRNLTYTTMCRCI
jgi:hypothetical protein